MAQTITELVRADDLTAYLALHGLRVVRGGWRWGEHHPYLIVAPAQTVAQADPEPTQGEEIADD